jgi:hypothetical protein
MKTSARVLFCHGKSSPPSDRIQRLDQQHHLGGFGVIKAGIFSEGMVAAAGGDRLEGGEEGKLVCKIGIGGELLQEEGCFGWRASGEGLADGQGQAARSALIFTAIEAIGEVG